MDFDLSKNSLLQKSIRDFTARKLSLRRRRSTERQASDHLIRKMADLRLFGMTLPVEYGVPAPALSTHACHRAVAYSGTGAW